MPTAAARLISLQIRDFRSYEQAVVVFPEQVGLLVGPNGVGKTNLLEAAAFVLTGSSPRTSSEARTIRNGASVLRLDATTRWTDGSEHQQGVGLAAGAAKRQDIDGQASAGGEQYAVHVPTVVFLPERLLVIRGAPARRRATLDRLTTRLQPRSTHAMREYSRAMLQRNSLLRSARKALSPSLEQRLRPWTELLARYGVEVRAARTDTLRTLNAYFADRFTGLTDLPRARLRLVERGPDLAAAFEEQLATDVRRGSTTAGPHLDEVQFLQEERDLRLFGSSGEQRSALLAWALAEADALRALHGAWPVVLLDEPYSELDPDRRDRLTSQLGQLGQVLVTGTEPPVHAPGALQVARVSMGEVHPWTT